MPNHATRESFPLVLVAGSLGFGAQEFYNIDVADRRLQSMESVTAQAFDMASDLRTLLLQDCKEILHG